MLTICNLLYVFQNLVTRHRMRYRKHKKRQWMQRLLNKKTQEVKDLLPTQNQKFETLRDNTEKTGENLDTAERSCKLRDVYTLLSSHSTCSNYVKKTLIFKLSVTWWLNALYTRVGVTSYAVLVVANVCCPMSWSISCGRDISTTI